MAQVVGRHRGFVAQYLGDGALVYLGYPQAREDDADCEARLQPRARLVFWSLDTVTTDAPKAGRG